MAGYKEAVAQAKDFWESRTRQQKGFLLGGAAATLLLLGLLVWLHRYAGLQAAVHRP